MGIADQGCERDYCRERFYFKPYGDHYKSCLLYTSIRKLAPYADDKKAQQEFLEIKHQNKVRLAKYIKEHNGIDSHTFVIVGQFWA